MAQEAKEPGRPRSTLERASRCCSCFVSEEQKQQQAMAMLKTDDVATGLRLAEESGNEGDGRDPTDPRRRGGRSWSSMAAVSLQNGGGPTQIREREMR